MLKRRNVITIATLMVALVILPARWGRIYASSPLFVSTTGNDSNNCLSPATPCKTIQAAINKAADGDTINYPGAVHIFQRKNLTVAGVAGAAISDPGLPLGAA